MIVQVGGYPPPIGGISIYIKRMKDFLDSKGIENQVWDFARTKKNEENIININFPLIPFYHLIRKNVDIIHHNVTGKEGIYYIGFLNRFLLKNRKQILTIHAACKTLFNGNEKHIVKSLNSFNVIICDNCGEKKYLLEKGVTSEIYEIPSFIFPIVNEKDNAKTPQKVWDFITSHKPIILANASNIVFYKGQDLYGLDMCIDLCTNLKAEFPKIGLIFSLPLGSFAKRDIFKFGFFQKSLSHINNHKYLEKTKQRIVKRGIEKNFLFNTEPCPLCPIIMKSDIFVRPTNTDGAAVSVYEALYLKTPALASDVVPRAEGAVLFKNRNIDDFTFKIKEIISSYKHYKEKLESIKMENNSEKIMKIYQKLLDE